MASSLDDDSLIGFLTINFHFTRSAEIHVMGIRSEYHREGIGRKLIEYIVKNLRERDVRYLQVKTVSDGSADPNYAKTRKFYEAVGFEPLEVFPTLWDIRNPCLQLMRTL